MEVDIIEVNIINEGKIRLYAQFLHYILNKIKNHHRDNCSYTNNKIKDEYHNLFFMITKREMPLRCDAIDLIEWLENNQMPSNIEQMFSEFLLERI